MSADRYTHGHHDAVLRSHRQRTAESSAAHLLPHLEAGQRLLDVGCGPGTITADLAKLVDPGEVVALDREPAVVEEAAATVAARGVDNVDTAVGDVYELDSDDDAFDVAHAHQVLQHLSRPVDALRELRRVTRPGGIVAVRDSDYAAMTWYPHDLRLDRWRDVYRRVARANGAEPDAGRHLLGWANAAGFSSVRASASAWCWADPETRRWWADLWGERMTASAVGEQAVAEDIATADDLADIAEGFHTWAEHPDGWFAVLHGEILARV